MRRRRKRNVIRLQKRQRQYRIIQRSCSANTSRSIEDNFASLGIHRLENRNRSTLVDLDLRTRCLRSGGTTRVGSSASFSHYFRS